jgi:maleylacetate reductase
VQPFVHDVPAARIVFECGAIALVGAELDRWSATRVMVVAGGPEAQYADRIAADLGQRVVARFSDVVMHVPVEVAQRAVALARDVQADAIVAVGGGSSTGMAKAVAKDTGLPILAVPTTYAGSEMTSIWGLTEGQRKTTGRDLRVLPRTVIYDPDLTVSLPADISAASGMNAIAHLVEGLYAPSVSPISFLLAEEGVRALAKALPRVVADPSDLDARGEALYGASLAGWTLGTTGMGVHHKICHTLGGTYDLPHAPSHSAVIAYATAFNAGHAPEAMSAIVRALNAAGIECTDAAEGIWELAARIGAPVSLASVGFREEWIPEAASIVAQAGPINPRVVDVDGVEGILRDALRGHRPSGAGQ